MMWFRHKWEPHHTRSSGAAGEASEEKLRAMASVANSPISDLFIPYMEKALATVRWIYRLVGQQSVVLLS